MIDSLWQLFLDLSPAVMYGLIFLLVALECSAFLGFLVPGETALILGGFAASVESITLPRLLVVASLAAIIGDSIGYYLGRTKGTRWALRYGKRLGVTSDRLSRAEALIKRYGGPAVFLGRFTSVARAFVPFVAGTGKLPYRTFLLFNVPGGILWACAFGTLGYVFGHQWERVAKGAGFAGAVLAFLLIVGSVLLYRRTRVHESS